MKNLLLLAAFILPGLVFGQEQTVELRDNVNRSDEESITRSNTTYFKIDDYSFKSYLYKQKSTGKIRLAIDYSDKSTIRRIPFEYVYDESKYVRAVSFFRNDNKFYMHVLYTGKENWQQEVYRLDLKNSTAQLENSRKLTAEELTAEFKGTKAMKNLARLDFENESVLSDKSNVYLIMTASKFNPEVGQVYGDILVTCISNGVIAWSKYIKRSFRTDHSEHFEVELEGKELIFKDMERKLFFDNDGSYIKGKDSYVLVPNFHPISYSIDKETGEFSGRKIKPAAE